MGGAWHGAGRELFLGLGPNNRNNGNNGVWLAVVVLVVSNRLLFKLGSPVEAPGALVAPRNSGHGAPQGQGPLIFICMKISLLPMPISPATHLW